MFKFALGALAAAFLANTANAAVVVTLRESNTGGVEFNLSGTGMFDNSVSLSHLGYVFFDNFGDPFQSVPLFSGNALQPMTLAPFAPVSSGVSIQSIVFDDDSNGDGSDDFALRFFGSGLSNGDPIPGPFPLQTSSAFSDVQGDVFGLQFSMLNPGTYTSSDAESNAFGGFTLIIEAPATVPLPAGSLLLVGGLGALALSRRRRTMR